MSPSFVYLLQTRVWYPVAGDAQSALLQIQLFKEGREAAVYGTRIRQHIHQLLTYDLQKLGLRHVPPHHSTQIRRAWSEGACKYIYTDEQWHGECVQKSVCELWTWWVQTADAVTANPFIHAEFIILSDTHTKKCGMQN